MAKTYRVTLRHSGPWAGCESEDTYNLSDWGYTDEEWDELAEWAREDLLNEWAEENFWNEGYEYNAEVKRG